MIQNEQILTREVETMTLDRDVEKAEFWKEGYEKGKLAFENENKILKNKIKSLENEIEVIKLRINQ